MGTIRTNDFVFIFSGGSPFSQTFPIENDFSLKQYQDVVTNQKLNRTLFTLSCGSSDINNDLTSVMGIINARVNGKLETIGQVCLLGRSDGCSLALAVAAELNSSVDQLTFVGVSDVTMFDSGRKPEVPKIGPLKPDKDPEVSAGVKASFVTPFNLLRITYPVAAALDAPNVKLQTDIKAKFKVNHFQTRGNHVKLTTSRKWVWFSSMAAGEVHGTVEGFTNRKFSVGGQGDLANHVDLNVNEHWRAMTSEASTAFASLPPDALTP